MYNLIAPAVFPEIQACIGFFDDMVDLIPASLNDTERHGYMDIFFLLVADAHITDVLHQPLQEL